MGAISQRGREGIASEGGSWAGPDDGGCGLITFDSRRLSAGGHDRGAASRTTTAAAHDISVPAAARWYDNLYVCNVAARPRGQPFVFPCRMALLLSLFVADDISLSCFFLHSEDYYILMMLSDR